MPLPDHHPALIVQDALRVVAPAGAPDLDLAAALLYGWATGPASSRSLAARSETDLGLQYLLEGRRLEFEEVRSFRDSRTSLLGDLYARALSLLWRAGLQHLGEIDLEGPGAERFVPLARQLLARSAAADERDDSRFGVDAPGDELPGWLASRSTREEAFAQMAAGEEPPPRPPRRRQAGRGALRAAQAVALVGVVLAGLVVVRWVATAAIPAGGTARPALGAARAVPSQTLALPEEVDLAPAARDEAMRLALEALHDDDLSTARNLYFLALQAVPGDQEAADRLRQVETALSIASRIDGWEDAVEDLGELRALAADSVTVLRAYLDALVAGGRQALATGDPEHALDLCGEAVRWFPARTDAQACLAAARAILQPPTPTPLSAPTPSLAPATPTPTVQPSPAATPGAAPPTTTAPAALPTASPTVGAT